MKSSRPGSVLGLGGALGLAEGEEDHGRGQGEDHESHRLVVFHLSRAEEEQDRAGERQDGGNDQPVAQAR